MRQRTSHKKKTTRTTPKKTQVKKPAKRTPAKTQPVKRKAPSRKRNVRHHKYWPDVSDEQAFWVRDGQVLKNLSDLPEALKNMDKDTFRHHVNKEKNDFANWIYHAVGDRDLAEEVRGHRSRTSIIRAIKSRL